MKTVGVREFRDQATTLIAAGETLVIERHGEPVGFYVPITATDRPAGRAALGRLDALVNDLAAQTGLDEDDLVREIGTKRRQR